MNAASHRLCSSPSTAGWPVSLAFLAVALLSFPAHAQQLPRTTGETLSGRQIVLADAVRGHPVILVAGFSREGGNGAGAWVKAIQTDRALAGISVYQIAQIAGAPSLIRGMIRSGMKKSVSADEHDNFVVLSQDEKPWRNTFDVTDDKVPYVMMIDDHGKMLWRSHGSAADQEPQLRKTARPGNR